MDNEELEAVDNLLLDEETPWPPWLIIPDEGQIAAEALALCRSLAALLLEPALLPPPVVGEDETDRRRRWYAVLETELAARGQPVRFCDPDCRCRECRPWA